MPRNYRTTNNNPNGPLFFGTINPRTGDTLSTLLGNIGIDTTPFDGVNGRVLSKGLYFSGATEIMKIYMTAGDDGTNRHFTLLPNTDHFMPIKDPTNIYIVGLTNGGTITVRGH